MRSYYKRRYPEYFQAGRRAAGKRAARVVSDVSNVEQWYLEERRDFINGLRVFCEERNYSFPFTFVDEETQPTTPSVHATQEISSQDVHMQKSSEEGSSDAVTN